ncbi:MAG TPA: 16S rRNA (cytosine(967)-C(5))-methyltransferase RsmB [Gammaproteobacteria bacterium]|nr:16S rRNA (cytosine(967)-C(5))-methyltransferase RsmB [Gammaproteobacteria bacterium]
MSPEPARAGAKLRAVAAQLVARVLDERVAADELLPTADVVARDRALLAALVFGALRWHYRLEWQAAQLLKRPLEPAQSALAALLRLGLLQLQELRIPEHAAVSATVDATALLGLRSARGLVNAVLRRFQREREPLARAAQQDEQARFAHPRWLIEAVRADRPADWQAVLAANNALAPMWLRVNALRTTRTAYLEQLERAGIAATADPDLACAVRLAAPAPVDALPGFAAGEVSVQDLSAQRAAELLELAPGQRVLDACAAPGGKTGHILEMLAGRGEVWAVDRDAARLGRVRDNLARLGLEATLVTGDGTSPADWWDGKPFDRILIDAPCSATGVIRRHPDIKVLRRPADVDRAVALQARLLRALWPLLAAGGRLVYATCSVLRPENEAQIAAFRAEEPTIEPAQGVASIQLLPEEARGDGFYYAWLRKTSPLRTPSGLQPQP